VWFFFSLMIALLFASIGKAASEFQETGPLPLAAEIRDIIPKRQSTIYWGRTERDGAHCAVRIKGDQKRLVVALFVYGADGVPIESRSGVFQAGHAHVVLAIEQEGQELKITTTRDQYEPQGDRTCSRLRVQKDAGRLSLVQVHHWRPRLFGHKTLLNETCLITAEGRGPSRSDGKSKKEEPH